MIEFIASLLISGSVLKSPEEAFTEFMKQDHACMLNEINIATLYLIPAPKRLARFDRLVNLPEKTKKEIRQFAIKTGFFVSPEEVAKYNQYSQELRCWIDVINLHLNNKEYEFTLELLQPVFIDAIKQGYQSVGWIVEITPIQGFNNFETYYRLKFSH